MRNNFKKIAIAIVSTVSFLSASCAETNVEIEFIEKQTILPKDNLTITENLTLDKQFENPVVGYDKYGTGNYLPVVGEGVGDPFVLRWNGRYYLYPSAAGMRVWSSENLVDWHYEGLCIESENPVSGWAPEVTYYNGKFYMYTSVDGKGHWTFVSDSPIGPFEPVSPLYFSENPENSLEIDGNVFIDDDGQWYFSFASEEESGIVTYKMTSPLTADLNSAKFQNLVMQAGEEGSEWTEGPMLVKYNGQYYITYCGNAVRSYGYRIDSASGNSPLNFTPNENNPLLICTDPLKVTSIGHSSTVLGPNLDSFYIVYHSMKDTEAFLRETNIAPLYFSGKYVSALGPTVTSQQAPQMPDIYSWFESESNLDGWSVENGSIEDGCLVLNDGGKVLSKKGFSDDYTLEANFFEINGKAGIIFGHVNEKNFGQAIIDAENHEIQIVFTVNNEEVMYKVPIAASFGDKYDWNKLQQITLRKCGNEYTFLLNNKTIGCYESELGSGVFGVSVDKGSSKVGFVAGEGNVWLSSIKEYFKPVEGELLAETCLETGLEFSEHDGSKYVVVNGSESYNYRVNVIESSDYALGIKYSSVGNSEFELYFNGNLLKKDVFESSDGKSMTKVVNDLNLTQGPGIFTVKIISGTAEIFNYNFAQTEDLSSVKINLENPLYSEGKFSFDEGIFKDDNSCKYLFGSYDWDNYTVSTDIKLDYSGSFKVKPLFRTTAPALGGENTDAETGTNFYIGYYLSLAHSPKATTVTLNKQSYGSEELAGSIFEVSEDATSINVKVEVYGAEIKVYIDEILVIEYIDPDPILVGAVGFQHVRVCSITDIMVSE